MARSSQSRSPVSLTVWLVAAGVVAAAVVGATQLTGGGSSSDSNVALSSARTRNAPSVPCTTSTAKIGPKSKWGTYVDKWGSTQHIGDGAVAQPAQCATTLAGNKGGNKGQGQGGKGQGQAGQGQGQG